MNSYKTLKWLIKTSMVFVFSWGVEHLHANHANVVLKPHGIISVISARPCHVCVRQKQCRRRLVCACGDRFFWAHPGSAVKSNPHSEPDVSSALLGPTGSVIKVIIRSVCMELILREQNIALCVGLVFKNHVLFPKNNEKCKSFKIFVFGINCTSHIT